MTRKELLEKLINFTTPADILQPLLNTYNWDSDQELVTLSRHHVVNVLNAFLQGNVSAMVVEDWANTIEGREDIGMEEDYDRTIQDVIFELANPLLTQTLDKSCAQIWIDRLQAN